MDADLTPSADHRRLAVGPSGGADTLALGGFHDQTLVTPAVA